MVMETPAQLVYQRPRSLTEGPTHYCPGCTHGVAHRLIAEVLDEMNLRERTVGVASVGCSVFAYNYFDCDFVEAAHAVATTNRPTPPAARRTRTAGNWILWAVLLIVVLSPIVLKVHHVSVSIHFVHTLHHLVFEGLIRNGTGAAAHLKTL